MTPEDEALLASVREALANPWDDPVIVGHLTIRRSEARTIERSLSRQALAQRNSNHACPLAREERSQLHPLLTAPRFSPAHIHTS
jgi:hypothetical protein